jgi:hypothetical protein
MTFLNKIREELQTTMYNPSERYTHGKNRRYNNNDRDNDRNAKRHAPSDRAPYQDKRTRSRSWSFD